MQLSTAAIKKMGFERSEGELTAQFYGAHVLEVRGFVADGDLVSTRGRQGDVEFALAIGNSLNDLSTLLAGEEFAADEQQWSEERKASPPYLLLLIGPTAAHSCMAPWVQHADSEFVTYDAFPAARAEIIEAEGQVLPTLRTALASAFNHDTPSVRFRHAQRATFGRTPEGQTLTDVRIEGHGTGYSSTRVDSKWLQAGIDQFTTLAGRLDPAFSRVFALALEEPDPLKRFLFFFLSLEIEANRLFKQLDAAGRATRLLSLPTRVSGSVSSLPANSKECRQNLTHRFAWCVVFFWDHLGDVDIAEFQQLKTVRNQIAHGAITSPPLKAVDSVANLAHRLHRSQE